MEYESPLERLAQEVEYAKRQLERDERRYQEALAKEPARRAAYDRAVELLTSHPLGTQLQEDGLITIRSAKFPGFGYAINDSVNGTIAVYHVRMGPITRLCIQSKGDVPGADVVLARLLLCFSDEEALWRTSNIVDSHGSGLLPKQARLWSRQGSRERGEAEEALQEGELVSYDAMEVMAQPLATPPE